MTDETRESTKPGRLPKFATQDEEATYWDTHSPLDYPDDFVEVKPQVRAQSPLSHTLAVRLDAETIDALGGLGRKKGVGPSTLARMWILERLTAEQEATRPKAQRKTRK